MMTRRELIRQVALLTGTAVVGGELFLSGCQVGQRDKTGLFTEDDISFFDEVAETILPKTNTPGAKDAAVGQFIAMYSTECYDDAELKSLRDGIKQIDEASKKMWGTGFMKSSAEQKLKLLTQIDIEAKKYNGAGKIGPDYFTLMKQLTMLGFFTSKPGATQVLHYVPVPGKYEGCIEYKKGDTSWA
jgi:Gluconate 2-dehydrogenase subunit 3